MRRRDFLSLAGLAAATAIASPALAQASPSVIKLTVATGHAPVVTWVRMLDTFFIPEVEKRLAATGKYKIEWTKGYGGTIAKVGGEIDAVDQNITDIAIVGATFNPAKLPLHVVSYYTPFASDNIETVVTAVDELHSIIPEMQKAWTDNRMVYLAGIGSDNFQLFVRKPVNSLKELNGSKIGGIGPNLNWLKGAGVAPVQVDPNSIYNDIATGVYDGVLIPTALAANLKTHEVAPYMLAMNFGAMSWGALAINKRKFDGLPQEVQTAIRDAGRAYQTELIKFQAETARVGLEQMKAQKLTVIPISPEARQEWASALPQIAKEWSDPLEKRNIPAKRVVQEFTRIVRAKGANPSRDWSVGM